MEETIKGVVVKSPMITNNPIAKKNMETVIEFYSLYAKGEAERDHFYSLWVDENGEPEVVTPFISSDIDSCQVAVQRGWDAVRTFFDGCILTEGTFDWTIDEFIPGEDPNIIITRSHSKVDITTPESYAAGAINLKYIGTYIQVFRFIDGKVNSFEEYYDTAMLIDQFVKAKQRKEAENAK